MSKNNYYCSCETPIATAWSTATGVVIGASDPALTEERESLLTMDRASKALDGDKDKLPDYVKVLVVSDMNGRKKQLYIPAALDLERPKRPRTTFTEQQLETLEMEFQENHFVSEGKRQKLAASLGLSETQIKVWFQNRRTKLRRSGQDQSSGSVEVSSTVNNCLAPSSSSVQFGVLPFTLPQHLQLWSPLAPSSCKLNYH